MSIISSAAPNAFLLKGRPAQFGTAWTSLSVGFNIVVTAIICVRLYTAYRRLRAIASPEYAGIYTGVAAIIIESALPYAFFGIIFSILYGLNNVSSLAFAIVWIAFTVNHYYSSGRPYAHYALRESRHSLLFCVLREVLHGQRTRYQTLLRLQ